MPALSGSAEDKGWVGSGWILVGSDPRWRQRARTGCAPPLPEAAHCPLQGLTRWTGKVYQSPPTPPSICPPGKPWLREGIVDSTAVSIFVDILVELTNSVFVNSTNITTNIVSQHCLRSCFFVANSIFTSLGHDMAGRWYTDPVTTDKDPSPMRDYVQSLDTD